MFNSPEKQSFLGELLNKITNVIKTGEEAGIKTDVLVKEVQRQISQTSSQKGGNPITGKGGDKIRGRGLIINLVK
ncbi:MAG: hypothetical protein QXJ06_05545 [Candidatus Aenigmatarchaeota archaeon]